MIILLEEILKLPSVSNAVVVSGQQYMWRKITSLRVLHLSETNILEEAQSVVSKNELIVTSFDEIWESPHLQNRFIEAIVGMGVIGIVVFSNVPGRNTIKNNAIELADALRLPIICLPGQNDIFMCGEAVSEISTLLKNADDENSLSVTMLECVAQIPQKERRLQAALDMLSGWVNASLILTDSSRKVIEDIPYANYDFRHLLDQLKILPSADTMAPVFTGGYYLYQLEITGHDSVTYRLFVSRTTKLERQLIIMLRDAVAVAIRMWGAKIETVAMTELISAIVQDEPMKMSRLASFFHVNVTAVDAMWIVDSDCKDQNRTGQVVAGIRACLFPPSALLILMKVIF